MKQNFTVTGMTCAACSAHVEKAVGKLPGVQAVTVSLLMGSMTAEYDNTQLNDDTIIQAVVDAGYGARVQGADTAAKPAAQENVLAEQAEGMKRRFLLSLCFMLPLFYLSMGHMMGLPLPAFLHGAGNEITYALTQLLLCLPVVAINRAFFQNGLRALWHRSPNMDSLIAVGSGASLLYGIASLYLIGYGMGHGDAALVERYSMELYFESAAMILTLITLGKWLESRSKGKTGDAVRALLDLAPKTAVVLRDGAEITVPADTLQSGDLLVIRAGARIAADGVITEGHGAVDQSALTGESVPVDVAAGSEAHAGTLCQSGYFLLRCSKVGADTALSQIITLVEQAGASKAPIARLADKIAGVFVPCVMAIAAVTTVVWLLLGERFGSALSFGIAVLVISCPCALGLATPVAIMVGTGKGAEAGILFKSAQALEQLGKATTAVLDKTGTVTMGQMHVQQVLPAEGTTSRTLLQIMASVEAPSEHPLAQAIVAAAKAESLGLLPVTDFAATPGQGVSATLDGVRYHAGNLAMLRSHDALAQRWEDAAAQAAEAGQTPLFLLKDNTVLGLVAIADRLKPTSPAALQQLHALGLRTVLLTGDNARTANAVARDLAIDTVIADVLPAHKEAQVAALQQQGQTVVMVGDGINDAPALARAHVGIAIGAGTDVAMEAAEVVLMRSDLQDVAAALRLSRAVLRNIKQNLFWAFFYNVIGIPIAAGVLYNAFGLRLSPMLGAAAMSLSSVFVVSNALRLRRLKLYPNAADAPLPEPAPVIIKEEQTMEKKIIVDGMMCMHCSGRVEKVLNALDGVTAKVDLEQKTAFVTITGDVSDDLLRSTIEDAGYTVVDIQ